MTRPANKFRAVNGDVASLESGLRYSDPQRVLREGMEYPLLAEGRHRVTRRLENQLVSRGHVLVNISQEGDRVNLSLEKPFGDDGSISQSFAHKARKQVSEYFHG